MDGEGCAPSAWRAMEGVRKLRSLPAFDGSLLDLG
jgi:hypothetical protein